MQGGVDAGATKIALALVDEVTGGLRRFDGRRDVHQERAASASGHGANTNASSIDRRDLDIVHSLSDLAPTRDESNVRARTVTEARLRAGREFARFLSVNTTSGTSSCLVIDAQPGTQAGVLGKAGALDHAHIGAA